MARHAARRIALQMVFADILGGGDCASVLENQQDMNNISEDQDFVNQSLQSVRENKADYDRIIQSLSPERTLQRIPALDRAILYLAFHELSQSDAQVSVIINEAVELAKRYGEESDSKFVNGVLGNAVREKMI